jgi:predicted site-specific integrase-resolvase
MKAKEVMEKYSITRRTLHNWVKNGIIDYEKTPSGRYNYKIKNASR